MIPSEFLSRQAASEWLAEQLPDKSVNQWALWLRNNANVARHTIYRIPVVAIGRGAFYTPDELAKFAEFEKARQFGQLKLTGRAAELFHAIGVGTEGATGMGRKWKGGTANAAARDGAVVVQAVIDEPLLIFVMTPEQAIEFGRELLEAGQYAQKVNEGSRQQNDDSSYTTLIDTPDLTVKRRVSHKPKTQEGENQ